MDSVLAEPKIDCHMHILDPTRHPYNPTVGYHPTGSEIGTFEQLLGVMTTYGLTHALVVQPNSGYGPDNSCMLDAVAVSDGRLKGVAIVGLDTDLATLSSLKDRGVVGVSFNPTLEGTGVYRKASPLMGRLADLDMFLNIQVELDQMEMFASLFENVPVTVVVDHCGRPDPLRGVDQRGFSSLLELAQNGRTYVKLSGYAKFSHQPYPFTDCWPIVKALVETFTLERCLWASDWPFLRATSRQDVGPLLSLAEQLFPESHDRRTLLWETPRRLLGFSDQPLTTH